ncbi:DUF1996 domain-containing protein [Streptomyces sp. NPDC046716]|uniref:DUF1996 domain-containing protein n=1 Tax=Streptomyces sp. NPDC046716 TaxID=3157093 RepID=UPI003407B437
MGRTSRKRRSSLATRMTIASAALLLGGGGLVAVNVYAQAHEENSADTGRQSGSGVVAKTTTIDCPDVGTALPDVPDGARGRVDGELAAMDTQITQAYQRLAQNRDAAAQDPGWVQNSVLGPLKAKRGAALDRIGQDIRRSGGSAPQGLGGMAQCTQRATDDNGGDSPAPPADPSADPSGGAQEPASPAPPASSAPPPQGGTSGGPVAADFQDITKVRPNVQQPRNGRGASTGTFTTACGTNANKLRNSDNVIVAPGVTNGAHHMHDYVGNQSNNAFASNDTFAGAATSCRNQGDKSTYYWPVLRVQDGTQEADANQDGGGKEGNIGKILQARTASIKFVGSPRGKVVAMPKFLRIITGDAKAFTNGTANANAHWSCTGFENRQLTDKYPICPRGSQVVRSFKFQSCWDGQNTDSANHRTHVAFADAQGNCPANFKAIPQLTMRLVYDVPAPRIANGQVKNPFAVDGFPEQLHKPITDHDDFINVFSDQLMQRATNCINRGDRCN